MLEVDDHEDDVVEPLSHVTQLEIDLVCDEQMFRKNPSSISRWVKVYLQPRGVVA